MNRKAIVTVVTRNYLHFALALADSAKRHHDDLDVLICLADRAPVNITSVTQDVELFYADELEIPDWKRFSFQYTPFELSCALKPYAMNYVLEKGYDEIIYLDSDMRIYDRLEEVFASLAESSILLTPHLLSPFPEDGKSPGENLFLAAGTFNGGFVAVRNDATAKRFVAWWSDRMKTHGHKDLAASNDCDQKWLSLVPGLFENVKALRNPGYNTGHWTLHQYEFSTDASGKPTIGGNPIVLFHFSNFSPSKPDEFSRCQNRFPGDAFPALDALVADYHAAVAEKNGLQCDQWGCAFAHVNDGSKIHPGWREAIRRNFPLFENVVDPFDVLSNPQVLAKFRSVEAKSYKWRSDWRLNPAMVYPTPATKPMKNKFKSFLYKIGLRKKAA
ncbi:hypothetical protein LOC68_04435 [Blastopirellula sp. JC732]|uniref:Nucleotide-diphospho-sugar transferase domain-containing protein n=1 Tax=Blastopirellula sediminis TaxID=2894196 RepID=A0A9X1MK14_9BACT|nr:putative nucleotide-diphospho-sugar transferase [Blastopirellula sediminis]MCC9609594.1 hypothetical protein [Blastopirellula sediminis]MCC9627630.1 hypothetical protein [Blastopirellula sediminis]